MGLLDSLLDVLEIAGHIANALFKDSPHDIADWINAMQDTGAASVKLKRNESNGILTVKAKAFDTDGTCIDKHKWQFECNSGIKRFMSGIGKGLESIVDIFQGEDEITYDLTDDDDEEDDDEKNEDFDPEKEGKNVFCSNCGNKLQENANFCAKCGKPVQG